MPSGADDYVLNVVHEENVIGILMLAKAAIAGQMSEHNSPFRLAPANNLRTMEPSPEAAARRWNL
jgi:hypothetical protein